jgi:hypothetical protein
MTGHPRFMDTMSKKELAQAKKLARALRIRHIRQRITTGAAVVVAVFSGIVLYRSIEQQSVATTTTATVAQTVGDDSYTYGEESNGDDSYGEESDEGGSTNYVIPSTSSTSTAPSTSSAPLVTSQS